VPSPRPEPVPVVRLQIAPVHVEDFGFPCAPTVPPSMKNFCIVKSHQGQVPLR
jgi:hypothetical protein